MKGRDEDKRKEKERGEAEEARSAKNFLSGDKNQAFGTNGWMDDGDDASVNNQPIQIPHLTIHDRIAPIRVLGAAET